MAIVKRRNLPKNCVDPLGVWPTDVTDEYALMASSQSLNSAYTVDCLKKMSSTPDPKACAAAQCALLQTLASPDARF